MKTFTLQDPDRPQNLAQWLAKYKLTQTAMDDLAHCLSHRPEGEVQEGKRESVVQANARLEAADAGVYLTRNNVGAGKLQNGLFMRWGLANSSKNENERIKSADLIGIRKFYILPTHVGRFIGQFVSRETKHSDWKYTGTPEEQAQLAWQGLVTAYGGDAKFITGPGSF